MLLFGGSFGGTHLTAFVAAHSELSGLVGFLMFPIAFLAGMRLWPLADVLLEKIRRLLTQTKLTANIIPRYFTRIIGSFSFVVTSVITCIIAGLILTPPAMQIVVDPGYRVLITAGTVYGIICWILTQLGYLRHADV